MRAAFIQNLTECAKTDERIWLLVGDLGYSVVEEFRDTFPNRFIDIGVAEQDMIGIATGLALSGNIVFVYSIANFPTLRCLEQIRNDACYHNANVKIVAVGGGFVYGAQGMSHHATEDLAIMRSLPNMIVVAPGDPVEAALATNAITQYAGTCYLRLSKSKEIIVHKIQPHFELGKAITIREGKDVTLICTGSILNNTVLAAERLAKFGIHAQVLSMHTIKPLDTEVILSAANETKGIITIEEHNIIGGLGSAVAEVLAEMSCRHVPFKRIALGDLFSQVVGSQEYLRTIYGLSVENICKQTQNLLGGN